MRVGLTTRPGPQRGPHQHRYLVEARDLDAWYADPEPDPAVLARAREDFGEAIATPELLDETKKQTIELFKRRRDIRA